MLIFSTVKVVKMLRTSDLKATLQRPPNDRTALSFPGGNMSDHDTTGQAVQCTSQCLGGNPPIPARITSRQLKEFIRTQYCRNQK